MLQVPINRREMEGFKTVKRLPLAILSASSYENLTKRASRSCMLSASHRSLSPKMLRISSGVRRAKDSSFFRGVYPTLRFSALKLSSHV